MNTKKARVFAAGKNPPSQRFVTSSRMIAIAIFCTILPGFSAGFASAQTDNFHQTGQIRAIVSETETETPSWKGTAFDAGFKFSGVAKSKVDFYFSYSTLEDGVTTEKWVALPAGRNWSELSNQQVRASGRLKDNKLLNAAAVPLARLSEDYLTNPPPTVGLYKVVAVPLTIQPPSAQGKSGQNSAALNVTPEAIRNTLFNAPNSVNKFYLEASYGMFGFTGVHHPQADVVPVTIQATISSNCQEQIMNQFTATVRQRLLEQNIDTTNGSVDLGIIIFNDMPGCPNYPFATRGALGSRGVPQWLWIPESWFATGPAITAHEIGHTLGGNHPLALRCADFDNSQTCVVVEANDRDLMTYGGEYYLMPNNYERRRWGWHPPGAFDNPSVGFVHLFDLQSPVLPFAKEAVRRGRFYFRSLMSGPFVEHDIYPEARRNWGRFERYQATDESFRLGIAVRIGHINYGAPEIVSVLIDPNDTTVLEDAPLRENQQVSIGGVVIKCLREHNPGWGTRMRVQ
ncbi:MAG TPA: hypothetical protein VF604_20730 [Pyrinomonadaceae bacterium]|jgi:hypothetical protein